MAVKINLMPAKAKNDWQGVQEHSLLSSSAIAIFVISVFVFTGVFFYKNYYLQDQLNGLKSANTDLMNTLKGNLQSNFILTNMRAKSAQKILSGHLYWSKFFQKLEENTLKSIVYDSFNVGSADPQSGSITIKLSGQTDDFKNLAKQLAVFQREKGDFTVTKFGGADLDKDGKVNFSIELSFKSSIVKF